MMTMMVHMKIHTITVKILIIDNSRFKYLIP